MLQNSPILITGGTGSFGNAFVPIIHAVMTRFMITLEQGVGLVRRAFDDMESGEINVKKIPSMKVTELASAISPEAKQDVVGIRPGEKLHEQTIGEEDAAFTFEYPGHYKILPSINNWGRSKERIKDGTPVPEGFCYTRDNNTEWMSIDELNQWIDVNAASIGKV